MDFKTIKESQTIELKKSENKLPSTLFETYSSFANTKGGLIIVGVEEKKPINIISGVANPSLLKRDFFNAVHNKTKVSTCLSSEEMWEEEVVEGKTIVTIKVPEAPRCLKPVFLNGNPAFCYIRHEDGDYLASDFERRALELDAVPSKFDSRPNASNIKFSQLNKETLKDYRSLFNYVNPDNLLLSLSDKEFFKTIGALKESNGEFIPTNAAIFLFGTYLQIKDIFPEYNLDYRENLSGSSRWDYRLEASSFTWSGNAFDFYRKSIAHIQPLLPNKFNLEGVYENGGKLILECVREGLANAIVNCDYLLPGGVVFLYEPNKVIFQNAGRMRTPVKRALIGGESDPRNEGIMNLLHLVKIGDKAGQGIPNIFLKMKKMGYQMPVLSEDVTPNKTMLSLLFVKKEDFKINALQSKIITLLSENGTSNVTSLASELKVSNSLVSAALKDLSNKGIVEDNGIATKGKMFFLKK